MALNVETLVRCGVPADKARRYLPLLARGMREFGITTRPRARMYLANLMHESGAFKFFEELASGIKYEGRRDLGNVHPGDGVRYKGRGPIQLTGRGNYIRYGKLLGVDLVNHPKLASEPRIGFRTAAAFFQTHGLNEVADRGDFNGVVHGINGGFNGLKERQRYFRILGDLGVVPGEAFIKRGDKGDAVVVLTRRLSKLHSPRTGQPYLDGQRKVFDRETQEALRHFQRDHGLQADGRYGPKSVKAITKAVEARKRRRGLEARRAATHHAQPPSHGQPPKHGEPPKHAGDLPGKHFVTGTPAAHGSHPGHPGPNGERPAAHSHRATSEEILDRLETLDTRSDRLREALRLRHEALLRVLGDERPLTPDELHALYEELGMLDGMITRVRTHIAHTPGLPPVGKPAEAPPAPEAQPAAPVPEPAVATVAPEPAADPPPTEPAVVALAEMPFDDLMERLEHLDAEADGIRAVVSDRSAVLERRLVEERRRRARLAGRPAGRARPPRRPGRGSGGTRAVDGRPHRPRHGDRAHMPTGGHRAPGGLVVDTRPGDRAHIVRQSKIALARYLRKKAPRKTRSLRRALVAEARMPRKATVATPTWERAVRAAQNVAGFEVTGHLDGRLDKLLRDYWPSEGVTRRMLRSTPAWRTIPGQLTRNFNIRELGCKDGTPYVRGLMREQGLSKRQARDRAKRLAHYLERVRAKEGGRAMRLTSAFRTKAYNATLPGAAPNSAHTRGFAADVPPPGGMSLDSHRQHMRAVFPSGIGFYPGSNFVHGDFDPVLGRRSWRG